MRIQNNTTARVQAQKLSKEYVNQQDTILAAFQKSKLSKWLAQ